MELIYKQIRRTVSDFCCTVLTRTLLQLQRCRFTCAEKL